MSTIRREVQGPRCIFFDNETGKDKIINKVEVYMILEFLISFLEHGDLLVLLLD